MTERTTLLRHYLKDPRVGLILIGQLDRIRIGEKEVIVPGGAPVETLPSKYLVTVYVVPDLKELRVRDNRLN